MRKIISFSSTNSKKTVCHWALDAKSTKHLCAFTLVEVLLSIIIIASMLIIGFYALSFITIGKVRLIENTKIQKESFYFSEKLFEMIKRGGVIDFEEYFNRTNFEATPQFSSGHYLNSTGFGNFGAWGTVGSTSYGWRLYYCLSDDGTNMWENGCISNFNTNSLTAINPGNYANQAQRFGQYAQQFLDFNADADQVWSFIIWDEDGDGNIDWDDDDEYIGQWPIAFTSSINLHELYLTSNNGKKRTMFRWNVRNDPDKPASVANCDFSNQASPTGTWCLWTIEFLELDARDWWLDHDKTTDDGNGSQFDGVIDTWIVNQKFSWNDATVFGSDTNTDQYWQSLFPGSVSVKSFAVYAYPNKDIDLAWKDGSSSVNQSPYVRLAMTLTPSWKNRKKIRGKIPEVEIATTIALNDDFLK